MTTFTSARKAPVAAEGLRAVDVAVTRLNRQKKISLALASASCALLGVGSIHAETQEDPSTWEVSTEVLFYSEPDRIQAIEPVVQVKKWLDTDETLTFRLTLDSLTGASATGAIPTDTVQTFTTPSGNSSYLIQPNTTPLDPTFKDTRIAFNAAWQKPLDRLTTMTLGGNISNEYDYLSISANALFSRDFNQRNTTLSAGISYASDTISPVGNVPIPFGQMAPAGEPQPRGAESETKTTADLLLGVTQIISRNSLIQVNYSLSQSDGYHTDPYKILTVVDDATGRPEFASGTLPKVLFENRPDSRTKNSLFALYKHFFSGDIMDLSYRYFWDDWGLKSNTFDLSYRIRTSAKSYWQPHLRYYMQSEVDFYQYYLLKSDVDAGNLPTNATADYRLGDMDAVTLGLKYGYESWSVAFEYYLQMMDEPDNKFGELNNQELAPDVEAVMLRFNYDF
jgi:hypothetical protein